MSKFRRSINPHLAGFLHIDLVVMVTCSMSLALVISLQNSNPMEISINAVPAVASLEQPRTAGLAPTDMTPVGIALESAPAYP